MNDKIEKKQRFVKTISLTGMTNNYLKALQEKLDMSASALIRYAIVELYKREFEGK